MLLARAEWEAKFSGYYKGEAGFCVPMSGQTYLGIGGPADVIVSPEDPLSVKNIMLISRRNGYPVCTLGGGTNILVRDGGIEGVIVKLSQFRRIEVISQDETDVTIFVEAGAGLQRLVAFCRDGGYAGVEGLAGIPGTVGGAICGNAGSFGFEIRDVIESVVIMNSDAELNRYGAEDLGFGYRHADIAAGDVVLSANLKVKRDDPEAVAARTAGFLERKKASQPVAERSAGCVFRNPVGLSAGKLIDEAGCKGMRAGGIEVSSVHANFFVNRGGGTAADYLRLMEDVALVVEKKHGVRLEPEITIIGEA
ncbi:MAG: UDP-N-acetylmuramate dehydrogenase [Thermodesulfovibrionales bacterium]